MQAVDVHAIAGAIRGLKKRKSLDVVPVSVAYEQMHFETTLRIFLRQRDSQFAHTSAAVKDEDVFSAANLHT